ncbi:hypothetical protein FI667_g2303, partial [Globisporangium splendens]
MDSLKFDPDGIRPEKSRRKVFNAVKLHQQHPIVGNARRLSIGINFDLLLHPTHSRSSALFKTAWRGRLTMSNASSYEAEEGVRVAAARLEEAKKCMELRRREWSAAVSAATTFLENHPEAKYHGTASSSKLQALMSAIVAALTSEDVAEEELQRAKEAHEAAIWTHLRHMYNQSPVC